jgi:hydroxymethylglutaryl-CoA lyase/(R)-citramalyl-CoA lyase
MLVCDVGPRDGLQNESVTLTPSQRAELCRRLAGAGVPRIEAVSFVDPRKVPQMAGAEEVVEAVLGHDATTFTGLILNERGFDRALATGLRHIQYALPVTESFCQRNQGVSLDQALAIGNRVVTRAREERVRIGVALAVSFGCPFEGAVNADHVIAIAEQAAAWGPDELSFADTIGVGVPTQVRTLAARGAGLGLPLGCHFHNTRNTGYANAVAALEAGIESLDASVGGVGGCPFAPRATGNIATEDLVYLLEGMGVDTGIDLERLLDTAGWLTEQLGHELPGQLCKAGDFALA